MGIGFTAWQQKTRLATDSASINNMQNVVELLRGLKFDPKYFKSIFSNNGIWVTFTGATGTGATDNLNFSCTLDGSVVTVLHGNIKLHGIGSYRVPTTTITLTGTPCFVFLYHNRDHSGSGIDSLTTPDATGPESDINVLRVPLIKCELVNGVYAITETCFKGDFQSDSPIR